MCKSENRFWRNLKRLGDRYHATASIWEPNQGDEVQNAGIPKTS